MPSDATLRIVLGSLAGGLCVFGALGTLIGVGGMAGLGGCHEEACTPDLRTFDDFVEMTLVNVAAFVLGGLVCRRLARAS